MRVLREALDKPHMPPTTEGKSGDDEDDDDDDDGKSEDENDMSMRIYRECSKIQNCQCGHDGTNDDGEDSNKGGTNDGNEEASAQNYHSALPADHLMVPKCPKEQAEHRRKLPVDQSLVPKPKSAQLTRC